MSRLSYRTLFLVGLASALGASGCVEADHPAFTVGWDLQFLPAADQQTGARVSCQDAGTPTVELTMTNLSSKRISVNKFPCDARGAQSEQLPTGRYTVRIGLRNQAGVEVSNNEGEFNLVGGGLTDLGVIVFEIQSFQISWSIHRGGNSLACQDVGATDVNLVTRLNSEPEIVYSFPCAAGAGFSPAILVGTYSVKPQLVSGNGAILREFLPMTVPVDDTHRAVLTPVEFDLQ
jgi:hypothetical protein